MASRLSPEQQMRHDLVVVIAELRWRRDQRGKRLMKQLVSRRGLR